jgi:hypothetical protein
VEIITEVLRQARVIGDAPIPFFILWAVLAWAAWVIAKRHHEERIATLEARVSLRDDQIKGMQDAVEAGARAVKEERPVRIAEEILPPLAAPVLLPELRTEPEPEPDNGDAPPKERVYVGEKVTPAFLRSFYRSGTWLNGDRAVQPYLGKWMRITAPVENVVREHRRFHVMVDTREGKELVTGTSLLFPMSEQSKIEILQIGDVITAEGRIDSVGSMSIMLADCSIIDVPGQR